MVEGCSEQSVRRYKGCSIVEGSGLFKIEEVQCGCRVHGLRCLENKTLKFLSSLDKGPDDDLIDFFIILS